MSRVACKICLEPAGRDGWLEHSKACFHVRQEGGGHEYIEDADEALLRNQWAEIVKQDPEVASPALVVAQIADWLVGQADKERQLRASGDCTNPRASAERELVYRAVAIEVREGSWKKP